MESGRLLKAIRRLGRLWFYICAAGVLTVLVAEKGVGVAFSVLRHGAICTLLVVYFLAVAFFGRWAGSRRNEREHPVSGSAVYGFFHNASPFAGGLAGAAAALAVGSGNFLVWIAAGSFLFGASTWLIASPLVYAAEMLLPSSRRRRRARVAFAKALRREEQLAKERSLAEVEANEQQRLNLWNDELRPKARELASLLITGPAALEANRGRIVDIGIEAWRLGGVGCMRYLHSMTLEASKEQQCEMHNSDYIAPCWEGIGSW